MVVYLPVFFAGVIFATAFRSSTQPDVDFGSNIARHHPGGLTEYLSLIFGFNHLIWIAIGYYALSWLLRPRAGAAGAQRARCNLRREQRTSKGMARQSELHSWDLTTTEARDLQLRLAAQVDSTRVLEDYETMAGADVSYDRGGKWLHAAVVVLSGDVRGARSLGRAGRGEVPLCSGAPDVSRSPRGDRGV